MVKQSIKTCKIIGTASLFAVTVLGSALAQDTTPQTAPPTSAAQTMSAPPAAAPTATGQPPLEGQSKEGFWGHMNPFARKKWVARQVDPIRDRTNELDELEAKNANDIRDVDARATAGISKAMASANAADQHAADASTRADAANSTAVTANTRTNALSGTVSNLDQYSQVTSTTVAFASGRTALGPKGKESLEDDVATQLASQKGYIVEVQGYSRAGLPASQAEADSVVRYLVEQKQVPLYRIYKTGLGKQTADQISALGTTPSADSTATASAAPAERPVLNGVRVTILHNSLASMDDQSGSASGSSSAKGGDQQ